MVVSGDKESILRQCKFVMVALFFGCITQASYILVVTSPQLIAAPALLNFDSSG